MNDFLTVLAVFAHWLITMAGYVATGAFFGALILASAYFLVACNPGNLWPGQRDDNGGDQ